MIKVNPFLHEHVKKKAQIIVRVPPEYHNSAELWSSTPRTIVALLKQAHGEVREVVLMACYASKVGNMLQVTTLRPAGIFKDNLPEDKTVLDAYMPLVLKALIDHGHIIGVKKVLVQSQGMPFIYDHLLDAGFQLRDHVITNGGVYEFEKDPES